MKVDCMRLSLLGIIFAMLQCSIANAEFTSTPIPANTGPHMVRVAYMVPCDRQERDYAVPNLQYAMQLVHSWYADEMYKWGLGRKSLRYETEADGITPKIHVVPLSQPESYFAVPGSYSETQTAALLNGVPVGSNREIWLLVPETHQQQPDGSFIGVAYVGGGAGIWEQRLDSYGIAWIGSEFLKFMNPVDLCNDETCTGNVDPDVGPYPMGEWPLPTTYRAMASNTIGGIAHELGHAFGLPHVRIGDGGDYPNLMAWGNYVTHGSVYPDRYDTGAKLSEQSARTLDLSAYFTDEIPSYHTTHWGVEPSGNTRNINPTTMGLPITQNSIDAAAEQGDILSAVPASPLANPTITTATNYTAPQANVPTWGQQPLIDGKLNISFTASDDDGLALAVLYWIGQEAVDLMVLSGTNFNGTFQTPYFDAPLYSQSENNLYDLVVYNIHGLGCVAKTQINPVYASSDNLAPRPEISAPRRVTMGQPAPFSASETEDPDDFSWSLQYEWDFDGDGVYDSNSGTTTSHTYTTPGAKKVRLRVTDPDGAWAETVWTTVWVKSTALADTNCDGTVDVFDIDPFVAALVDADGYALEHPMCSIDNADINNDRMVDVFDIDSFVAALVAGN